MEVLDLRGLPCPKPFETFMKRAYVFDGDAMKVIVDNPYCFEMIVQFAPYLDCEVVNTKKDGNVFEVEVKKAKGKGEKKPEKSKERVREGC